MHLSTCGANLTLGSPLLFRHAGESGHPELAPGLNRGRPASCLRPWTPASAGATRKRNSVPFVWFVPLAAASDDELSQAILPSGRIVGRALERVVQCPHPAAAQIQVKEQIELACSGFVPPYRCRRFFGPLGRDPQQAGCRRLVQADQLLGLRWWRERRGGRGRRWFRFDHGHSLVAGFGSRRFGRRRCCRLVRRTRSRVRRMRQQRCGLLRRRKRGGLGGWWREIPGARDQDAPQAQHRGMEKQTAPRCPA